MKRAAPPVNSTEADSNRVSAESGGGETASFLRAQVLLDAMGQSLSRTANMLAQFQESIMTSEDPPPIITGVMMQQPHQAPLHQSDFGREVMSDHLFNDELDMRSE